MLVSAFSAVFLNVLSNRSSALHFWRPLATLRMRALLQHFTTKCCTSARPALRDLTGSNPCRGNRFLPSPKRPGAVRGPMQPPSPWLPAFPLPGVKRPRREANHSPPSSAEAQNERSCTSTPLVYLQGTDRDNLTFLNYGTFI
jgi:hypothetical protein